MKNLLFLFSFLTSGCISFFTIPPHGVAYIRDPEIFPDEPDWKDPRHIMFVNNSHFYITVRINGEQIRFQEYVRKAPETFYLAPDRVANMLLADRGGGQQSSGLTVYSVSRSVEPTWLRIELRAYLAPDFQTPVASGEKSIEIKWGRYCQRVEIGNGDFH